MFANNKIETYTEAGRNYSHINLDVPASRNIPIKKYDNGVANYYKIAGLDVSYSLDRIYAVTVIVVFNYDDFLKTPNIYPKYLYKKIIYTKFNNPCTKNDFVRRESALYADILNIVKENDEQFYPNLLLIDGHGCLIKDNVATIIGKLTNIPSIGIGKQHHLSFTISKDELHATIKNECTKKGDYIFLKNEENINIGAAVVPSDNFNKHFMYVSIGYKITLESAIEIIQNVKPANNDYVVYPIRSADNIGRTKLNEYLKLFNNNPIVSTFICALCDKVFFSPRRLKRHRNKYHYDKSISKTLDAIKVNEIYCDNAKTILEMKIND